MLEKLHFYCNLLEDLSSLKLLGNFCRTVMTEASNISLWFNLFFEFSDLRKYFIADICGRFKKDNKTRKEGQGGHV